MQKPFGGVVLVLKILFFVCLVLEAIFTPWYLKALWPQKCFKSLVLKMICASLFVAVGVLSVFIAGNTSQYAIMMLVGLAFGWVGDYFLHAKPSNTYFAIGFTSFLIGHLVYIAAYVITLPKLFPEYKMFNLVEILIGAVILAISFAIAIFAIKMKFNPKPVKYAVVLYAVIIVTMFLKASALGIKYYLSGAEGGIYAALVLTAGSFFFVLSDASLAVILFGGKGKSYPLKIFNIVTYFWGQIMLASSILFINA